MRLRKKDKYGIIQACECSEECLFRLAGVCSQFSGLYVLLIMSFRQGWDSDMEEAITVFLVA